MCKTENRETTIFTCLLWPHFLFPNPFSLQIEYTCRCQSRDQLVSLNPYLNCREEKTHQTDLTSVFITAHNNVQNGANGMAFCWCIWYYSTPAITMSPSSPMKVPLKYKMENKYGWCLFFTGCPCSNRWQILLLWWHTVVFHLIAMGDVNIWFVFKFFVGLCNLREICVSYMVTRLSGS